MDTISAIAPEVCTQSVAGAVQPARLRPDFASMATKSERVRVTPLIGGRNTDGVCTLLEIGGMRLLLDCGCGETDLAGIKKIANDLSQIGGVHGVLLSHADMHHIGALPFILGKGGLNDTPIFCTGPVSRFGQVLLYDYALNRAMEGVEGAICFDLDDVDSAFSRTTTLKFNQVAVVPERETIFRSGPPVTICAVSSGRTIGGSIWRIRCGPTEVVYMVDVNLKKEVMLDGLHLESLPSSPTLLITEGGSRAMGTATTETSGRRGGKKEKEDNAALIASVMETMRAGGNVLIPAETAGRSLELMQVLGKHWYDNQLGLYNLVFLSHMAKNVPEFARMQLEWMSDSLARGFYNGKPNPFDLPQIRFATSLREIERFCPGPKTVIATDAGLSSGLAKELLLKWGGDPRCRVLFLDSSDPGSLAAELRQKAATPPVIASITRPVRVELEGAELVAFRAEQEKQRRLKEEAQQRKRRQEELARFNAGAGGELVDDEEDALLLANAASALEAAQKKPRVDLMRKFLEPNFTMFESKEVNFTVDEYGASIDDLHFRDIQSNDIKWLINRGDKAVDGQLKPGAPPPPPGPNARPTAPRTGAAGTSGTGEADESTDGEESDDAAPTKLVATTMRVQFTCEFKELNLGGRADLKAIKTLVSKMTPARMVVLRGSEADCASMLSLAKTNNMEGFAPLPRASVAFEVLSEKLRLQVPQALLPSAMRPVRVFQTSTGALVDTKCSVVALLGTLEDSKIAAQEGTRLIKYQGIQATSGDDTAGDVDMSGEHKSGDWAAAEDGGSGSIMQERVTLRDNCIGAVSVGEVTLNSLRLLVEATGTTVENRIDGRGALLVCGEQVVVRKENLSDFVIEGPPVPAFYDVRRALYQQFAFV